MEHYPEAIEQCRRALERDPKDQTALYHLIQACERRAINGRFRISSNSLALLRKQAAHDQSERFQYKLVEDDVQRSDQSAEAISCASRLQPHIRTVASLSMFIKGRIVTLFRSDEVASQSPVALFAAWLAATVRRSKLGCVSATAKSNAVLASSHQIRMIHITVSIRTGMGSSSSTRSPSFQVRRMAAKSTGLRGIGSSIAVD